MDRREKVYEKNNENIIRLLEIYPDAKFIDLGCDDGVWTMKMAGEIRTEEVYGIELIKEATKENSWQYQRIFTIYGLKQLGELGGFTTEKVLVSG